MRAFLVLDCVRRRSTVGFLRFFASTSKTTSPPPSALRDAEKHLLLKKPRGSMTIAKQLKIYSQLSKARLSALVVMTTSAGFFMAGAPVGWGTLAATCVGTTLAACSANTFNQLYEVKTDALMNRTRGRPLPMGKISRMHATVWGLGTGVASAGLLAMGAGPLVAGLGVFNIGLYAGVYTPMKLKSEWNTWVGAIVGAIPPVMGYAAVTGTVATPEAALLSSTLFLWQFPHFFSLAWIHKADYASGGYKMVPVADPTGVRTAQLVERYAAYMVPLPLAACAMDVTSYMFAVESIFINGYAYMLARNFANDPNKESARKVFKASLWYLPVMLTLMVYHSKTWEQKKGDGMAILDAKSVLKEACPHEVMFSNDVESNTNITADNKKSMCPIPDKMNFKKINDDDATRRNK